MTMVRRKRERTPNHLTGAIFGGVVGVILGVITIAVLRNADMAGHWQNSMAGGLVVGSAIGARFPIIAELAIDCFQACFP